jgi:hypothetical protein
MKMAVFWVVAPFSLVKVHNQQDSHLILAVVITSNPTEYVHNFRGVTCWKTVIWKTEKETAG